MKKKRVIQASILIFSALAVSIVVIWSNLSKTAAKPEPLTSVFSKPFHDIKGFHFSRAENGQRIFVLQADRFRVQKKKLGKVRFGLLKEIIVDNAKIDIYQPPDQEQIQTVDWQSIAGPEMLTAFKTRATAKIIFSPISLQVLSQEGHVLSRISAGSASYDLEKKQIVFDQHIEINSGNRILHAGTLTILSKDGRIIAEKGVEIETLGKEELVKKEVLYTDIFLNLDDEKKGVL